MIRAQWGDSEYWKSRISFRLNTIENKLWNLKIPAVNATYEAEYVYGLATEYARLLLQNYSSGTPIPELPQHFQGILDAWELSNRLSDEICAQENLSSCRDWDFSLSNLNHYNWCFWLIGLAILLDIPEDQWLRLLALVGGAGEDVLLDRIIQSRHPSRLIGVKLIHTKPYARLLKAIDAPKEQQATLLKDFVTHWYAELKRPTPKNKREPTVEPFWYIYGDPIKHPLEMGSYFGRWCIEAAVAAKVFGIDDGLCLGHDNYPGDLLRPSESTTHPQRAEAKSIFGVFGKLFKSK